MDKKGMNQKMRNFTEEVKDGICEALIAGFLMRRAIKSALQTGALSKRAQPKIKKPSPE